MRNLKLRTRPFHRIGDSYGSFFDQDHFMGRSAFEDTWIAPPKANISKNKEGYHLELAMPGVPKNDINVRIEDGALIIEVNRASPENDKEYLKREMPMEFGRRVFQLTEHVDLDKISAKFKDGVLIVKLPYKPDASLISHQIKVA